MGTSGLLDMYTSCPRAAGPRVKGFIKALKCLHLSASSGKARIHHMSIDLFPQLIII